MSPERKAEIVEAIVRQFEATGLRPARGEYKQIIGGDRCACAVGVFGQRTSNGVDEFCAAVGVSAVLVCGVFRGFDGHKPAERDISPDQDELDGYDIGAAVWERVSHLAVEVTP